MALLLLAVPGTLLAGPGGAARFLVPGAGARLEAGQEITVRWSALPADTREFELLLLLDETSTTTVRLTVELDPRRRTYRWKVPDLPAPSARLQIRFSRGAGEVIGATSERFEILSSSRTARPGLAFHGGEWWLVRAWESSLAPIIPPRAELGAAFEPSWPLEPLGWQSEQDHLLASRLEAVSFQMTRTDHRVESGRSCSAGHRPSFIPQRE